MDAVLKIQFTGSEASCLIEADATAQTLTSKIGALGSESADSNFGTAGVLDLDDYDTLDAVATAINAYDDYTAEVTLGDDSTEAAGLLDATAYAKPDPAYIYLSSSVSLATYALITWSFAKSRLDLADSQQDLVTFLINSASSKANQYAHRVLAAKDYTEKLNGSGTRKLFLSGYPINSITDVRVDSERAFGSSSVTTDYAEDANLGILHHTAGTWPKGFQNVQVTYNGGYSSVPEDLQEAVLEVVAWSMRRMTSGAIGTRSQSGEGMTTEYELTVPTNAQRVFESYRDWRMLG